MANAMLPTFTGMRVATPGQAAPLSSARAAAPRCVRSARLAVRAAAVARETDPKKRIVITGMGVCSVFGNDPVTYYDKLLAGTSGISLIERFDASEYPTRFGGQIKDFECATPHAPSVDSLPQCKDLLVL